MKRLNCLIRRHLAAHGRLLIPLLLLAFLVAPDAAAERIRILHTNDLHAHLLPFRAMNGDTVGGFARLATLVDSARGGAAPCLLLDAGDCFQGTPYYNFFRGEVEMKVMSAIGYDAMAMGNHELDDGAVNLLQQANRLATFPLLCANIDVRARSITLAEPPDPPGTEPYPPLARRDRLAALQDSTWRTIGRPYVILPAGERHVAVIGITTETLPVVVARKNLTDIRVRSTREAVQALLPEVRRQADLIVVLSHCGLEADSALAKAVPGIDIIVSAHDHRLLPAPILVRVPGATNGLGGTLLVETGQWGQNLGVLDIDLEDGRLARYEGRLWPVTARLAQAPRVKTIADVYQEKLAPLVNAVVATSTVPLPGDSLLYQETALGNLITDIMRQRAGADIAFQNAGGIRGELPAGEIRVGDVYTLLPFDNTMVVLDMTGADVARLCRESAGRRGRGGFGQVSGLSFDIAADGPRNLRVGGLPVDPKQRYRLVTNSYTASGGDGYGAIGKSTARQDTDLTVREAVMTGLRQLKTVSPKVEGRIRFVK